MILFYLFLRPRPFRERSLAHAFTFFFFCKKKQKNEQTHSLQTKNRSPTHSQRKTPGSSRPTGPSRSRRWPRPQSCPRR